MIKLYIYDASVVNRKGYKWTDYKWGNLPVEKGFRDALKDLNPKKPFLVRTILGDYEDIEEAHPENEIIKIRKRIIQPTFEKRGLKSLLNDILYNGNDRSDENFKGFWRWGKKVPKHIKSNEVIWAIKYNDINESHPYRIYDDSGEFPQGEINDLSMIFDSRLYISSDKDQISFYQQDLKKRKQSLLGIIISDMNPDRAKLQPLKLTLTINNLDRVYEKIKKHGYF